MADPSRTVHLTREEFASLQEVDKGLMQGTIPPEHEVKLVAFRLLTREVLGG